MSGCVVPITGGSIAEEPNLADAITNKLAALPMLELDTKDKAEKYKGAADKINSMIDILNEQGELFDLPKLDTTRDTWSEVSSKLIEYGPLIDNYGSVVTSAQEYESDKSDENLNKFYIASGKFAFEFSLIYFALFYGVAYESTGIIYRWTKLNRLAFKCPSCVRVILSDLHWTIRGGLVEGSSLVANQFMNLSQTRDLFNQK